MKRNGISIFLFIFDIDKGIQVVHFMQQCILKVLCAFVLDYWIKPSVSIPTQKRLKRYLCWLLEMHVQ